MSSPRPGLLFKQRAETTFPNFILTIARYGPIRLACAREVPPCAAFDFSGSSITKSIFTASLVALSLTAAPALAGGIIIQSPPMPTAMGDDETSLFAGLNWTFGQGGSGLDGVVGIIYSEVDAGGDVSGGILSLNFDLQGRGNPADMRLVGFTGNGDVAGQLGFGFNLDGSGGFGLGGFLTSFLQGGATIDFNGDLGGFLGIHSHEFLEPRMTMGPGPVTVMPGPGVLRAE